MRSSFLPGAGTNVGDKLDKFAMHTIDLKGGAVLERGCVYIVELQESLRLRTIYRRWQIRKVPLVDLMFSPAL